MEKLDWCAESKYPWLHGDCPARHPVSRCRRAHGTVRDERLAAIHIGRRRNRCLCRGFRRRRRRHVNGHNGRQDPIRSLVEIVHHLDRSWLCEVEMKILSYRRQCGWFQRNVHRLQLIDQQRLRIWRGHQRDRVQQSSESFRDERVFQLKIARKSW